MNTVILTIKIPERSEHAKEKAWNSARADVNDLLRNVPNQIRLGENVFLMSLPSDLSIFSSLVSLLELKGIPFRVLYFDGEPQWTFES